MKSPSSEQGAAVVEFAILFILLMVFLFGIVEFGFIWVQSNYIANAAREGARVASRLDSPASTERDKVETAVKDYLKGLYPDAMIDSSCCSSGDFIAVTIDDTGTVTGGSATVGTVEVDVTAQTWQIWEPVLWDLVKLLPGVDADSVPDIRQITESAVFTKEPN
jgi:Flp pilus assembly protein TadG